nr:MAG: ORF1 [TTV-like mini virus]
MPPYWRRRRRTYWRRRGYWPRRIRAPFWRRRRTRWRRKYWVRRKKKLITLKLKEYQPTTIKKCKIKGMKCLFQGSAQRLSFNYWQYPISYVPESTPGGGGWGLMALSLSSFFEDWEHLQNIFTASNAGLPLVRINGFKLVFYQHDYTDYVVEIDRCWPMLDTPLKHPNCQPSRMLMSKKKIIVPSIQTKPLKRRRKKIFVKPPSQLQNKWYFQKELCNTKLIMIAASACSLTDYYLPSRATSNNITLYALNTNIFKNADFQNPGTTGYQPRNNVYLYSATSPLASIDKTKLIYLGDPKTYTAGQPGDTTIKNNWGNPFYKTYLQGTAPVYTSTKSPTDSSWQESQQEIIKYLTDVHYPLANKVRYNPDRDTGLGNSVYFIDNYRTQGDHSLDEPLDNNRKILGFPLWISLWGWPDWIKKLAEIQRVDDDYMIVIKSDFFSEKYPYYLFLDDTFIKGKGIYETEQTTKDLQNWYPKYYFQQNSMELICKSGPGVARTNTLLTVQAKMGYTAYLKWGGCPSTLEKIYDPCSQPTWPTPHNLEQGLQIQNPEFDPAQYFYSWDVRRDLITETALKRLQKVQKTDTTLCSTTGTKSGVPALKTHQTSDEETPSSEEEETTLNQRLLRLQRNQRLLQLKLLRLIKNTQ